jgi:YfiH family protein
VITPDWRAPGNVRALVTTRDFGDLKTDDARDRLAGLLPAAPAWLKQVHGKRVVRAGIAGMEADAATSRDRNTVCLVQMADCMPVLFCDDAGTTVAAAHAGWRGLSAGVLEATVEAMGVRPGELHAWLGPAIGPSAYEIGEDVRAAFRGYESALRPSRPGHWYLDLYAVARDKLRMLKEVAGGGFCTYSERERFFSYRRERTPARMAAAVWLT